MRIMLLARFVSCLLGGGHEGRGRNRERKKGEVREGITDQ